MKQILELCIELDQTAENTYRSLALAASNEDLRQVFNHMGAEETAHIGWWSDLLVAWDSGLVPAVGDESDLLARLRELEVELAAAIPEDLDVLDDDAMLDIAARLEFYLLDPIFGELLDLTGPGAGAMHREAYARHVMRLVGAVEEHHSQSGLAYFLARVLERSFQNQQRLSDLATHDQLTGVYNRHGFYSYLKQWTSWADRYQHSLAVALVDVDHFKSVNDTLGHAAGDEALTLIADALSDAIRGSDIVGRSGGDEFAVLAPETSAAELDVLMTRIVELVRALELEHGGQSMALTVSVGGSFVRDTTTATAEQLFAAADVSLYAAKGAGRDRAGGPIEASTT